MKKCMKCKQIKSFDNFHKNKNNADGHVHYCKDCIKIIRSSEKCKKQGVIRSRRYRTLHPERTKEMQRKYMSTAPGIFKTLKHVNTNPRYRLIHRKLLINKSEFIQWYNEQPKKCNYCNSTLKICQKIHYPSFEKYTRLTIDRKNNNKDYSLDNITLACPFCNSLKGYFFSENEMLEIGKIIKDKIIFLESLK